MSSSSIAVPGSPAHISGWRSCFRAAPSMVPEEARFQNSQSKKHVWIRHHNTFHSQISNGWVPSWISTRWIIFQAVGIAAHLLAVIVNTAIFYLSGYQSAPFSDTELCWPKNCLPAFRVLQRSVLLLMRSAAWIFSAYQIISHWKINALPTGWLSA